MSFLDNGRQMNFTRYNAPLSKTQEKLIAHVMRQNGVDRDKAVNALKKAGKL